MYGYARYDNVYYVSTAIINGIYFEDSDIVLKAYYTDTNCALIIHNDQHVSTIIRI